MAEKYTHQVIFCIVNSGFSEVAMDAAKKAGARGGTILNARGTGAQEAEAFFGISVQPEKEIVMIVAPTEDSDKILQCLYDEVGLNSHGQGIAFAVPVDGVVGLATPQEENKEN
jgi:nitrogen regulatory protein PII